jgi:ankyrin repeat protein
MKTLRKLKLAKLATGDKATAEYELAVRKGDAKKLRGFVENGIKPPARLMLFALICKQPKLLPVLKEAGANPNDLNGFNETALGRAVTEYPPDVVKVLLELGADPNKESLHLLPLVHAAYDDQIECLKALLRHGANPSLPQWNGVIPLHAAVRNGQYQAVKVFLEAGANPKIKGPDGKDSMDLAKVSERFDLLKLMRGYVKKRVASSKLALSRPSKRVARSKALSPLRSASAVQKNP